MSGTLILPILFFIVLHRHLSKSPSIVFYSCLCPNSHERESESGFFWYLYILIDVVVLASKEKERKISCNAFLKKQKAEIEDIGVKKALGEKAVLFSEICHVPRASFLTVQSGTYL